MSGWPNVEPTFNEIERIKIRAAAYEYSQIKEPFWSFEKDVDDKTPVGYLLYFADGWKVVCNVCSRFWQDKKLTPIFEVNIHPYWQRCYSCKHKLVIGNPNWTELFPC